MDIEIDSQRIVNRFKRNGHLLNKYSLQMVSDHLKSLNNPHKHLDELITKLNQMVIMQKHDFNDKTLKMAIQLLNHKTQTGQSFTSYDKFLDHLQKWTIYYVSPYQSSQRFFVDRPDPSLFKFEAPDYLQMNKTRFKAIREHNLTKQKKEGTYTFLGVLFEKFVGTKSKIMLQNQVNELQLTFPPDFQLQLFLIPGSTYIAHGDFKSSDLQLIVKKIQLPQSLPPKKQNLLSSKLKFVFDSISNSKIGLDFTVDDFKKYEIIYNKKGDKGRPILMFGNFKINALQIAKVKNIIKKFPRKAECIFLFLSENGNQKLDINKQLNDANEQIPVYIIPNINSEGPRILPKIPILKQDYNAKVVTNPCRFSIQGKQCLMLNYPLVKNLYSKSLKSKEVHNINEQEIAQKVSKMLYSQNNIALTNKIFWKQSPYFDIHQNDLIFIFDSACPQVHYQPAKGGFVSIGNFQRDADFVCFMPHSQQAIQLCNTRNQ